MRQTLRNILRLGLKELFSLRRDRVMVILIFYTFSLAIFIPSKNALTELRNASVAIVDEDRSQLSQRLRDALLPPFFQTPALISAGDIDRSMDFGRYTFVIDIPPSFEADLLADRRPAIQINVDATAMTQAGVGASYLQRIIGDEIENFTRYSLADLPPLELVVRAEFNPNLNSTWFLGVAQLINMITIMSIILTGAALIREREHGTVEHLLVMPLRPVEIMLAKVWASALVIIVATLLSLQLVVRGALQVPVSGSLPLFALGLVCYLFAVTALGIFLATLARSMPQFGLLAFPVFIVMNLLSGATTPLESIPAWLQQVMQLSPSTHFVSFSQTVLYRGGGMSTVWREVVAIAMIGLVFFLAALRRFRMSITFV